MTKFAVEVRRTTFINYEIEANSEAEAEVEALDDAETCYGTEAYYEIESVEAEEDDELGICPSCSGSGEGMHEGTSCHRCKGKGES